MIKKLKVGILTGVLLSGFISFLPSMAGADAYKIDSVHSSIGFSVSHLMVSQTTGVFNEYEGVVNFDPKDVSMASTEVTIQTASIDTRSKKRDDHLRTADFFDVENHPQMTFKSKTFVPSGDKYLITGDLTIKGITKEIAIPVKITGPAASPMGGTVLGLSGQVTINRQDFGISWNKSLDNGGMVVGNDVDVLINIEAGKQ